MPEKFPAAHVDVGEDALPPEVADAATAEERHLAQIELSLREIHRVLLDLQYRTRLSNPELGEMARRLALDLTEAWRQPIPKLLLLPWTILRAYSDNRRRRHDPLYGAPADMAFSPWGGPADELVSVVMTTFNSASFMATSVEAVLSQSYQNIELIIVDDASTDDSFETAESFSRRDPRVRPFKLKQNQGTYFAKNFGILQSRGAYFATHDSDDVTSPDWLALHMGAFKQRPEAVLCASKYTIVNESGEVVTNRGVRDRRCLMNIVYNKKRVLGRVGYFDSVRSGADQEYYDRIICAYGEKRCIELDLPLYTAFVRKGQLTQQSPVLRQVGREAHFREFLSSTRMSYQQAARDWHRKIASKKASPYVPFPLFERPFPVPPSLIHDPKLLERSVVFIGVGTSDLAAMRSSWRSSHRAYTQLQLASASEDRKRQLLAAVDQLGDSYFVVAFGQEPLEEDVVARLMFATDLYEGLAIVSTWGVPVLPEVTGCSDGQDRPLASAEGIAVARRGQTQIQDFVEALLALFERRHDDIWRAGIALVRLADETGGESAVPAPVRMVPENAELFSAASAKVVHSIILSTKASVLRRRGVNVEHWLSLAAKH